jgi:hypothetical protein
MLDFEILCFSEQISHKQYNPASTVFLLAPISSHLYYLGLCNNYFDADRNMRPDGTLDRNEMLMFGKMPELERVARK